MAKLSPKYKVSRKEAIELKGEERTAHERSILCDLKAHQPLRFLLETQLLPFGCKRALFAHLLACARGVKRNKKKKDEPISLVVPRTSVTEVVCKRLGVPKDSGAAGSARISGMLHVAFRGEEGVDEGGARCGEGVLSGVLGSLCRVFVMTF